MGCPKIEMVSGTCINIKDSYLDLIYSVVVGLDLIQDKDTYIMYIYIYTQRI